MHFLDKVVFVTGASSGIGRQLSLMLAKQGAKLFLFARRADRLQNLEKEISAFGGDCTWFAGDISSSNDVQKAITSAYQHYGKIDIFVANAGCSLSGTLESVSIENIQRLFLTNVMGTIYCIKAVLPYLKETKGQLVLTGSVGGYVAAPNGVPYSASKHAIHALANGVRAEVWADGVSVTLLVPGCVESEMWYKDNNEILHTKPIGPKVPFMLSTEKAVQTIVSGIARRKKEVIISKHARFFVYAQRFFPRFTELLIHSLSRSSLKVSPEHLELPNEGNRV